MAHRINQRSLRGLPIVLGLTALITACGDETDPLPDLGTQPPADAGARQDASTGTDAGSDCVSAPSGQAVTLSQSVHWCAGTISIPVDATRRAAIDVTASNITIVCDGTVFENAGAVGTTADPTLGFLLENVTGVRII